MKIRKFVFPRNSAVAGKTIADMTLKNNSVSGLTSRDYYDRPGADERWPSVSSGAWPQRSQSYYCWTGLTTWTRHWHRLLTAAVHCMTTRSSSSNAPSNPILRPHFFSITYSASVPISYVYAAGLKHDRNFTRAEDEYSMRNITVTLKQQPTDFIRPSFFLF